MKNLLWHQLHRLRMHFETPCIMQEYRRYAGATSRGRHQGASDRVCRAVIKLQTLYEIGT